MTDYYDVESCPYLAWKHYLPEVPYNPTGSIITKIKCGIEYLGRADPTTKETRELLYDQVYFDVNMDLMIQDAIVLKVWPKIKLELEERGELVSGVLGLAKHHIILQELKEEKGEEHSNFPTIRARILFTQTITPLRVLKSSFYNKLVTIKGTVIRVTANRPVNSWLLFQCNVCGKEFTVYQAEGKYTLPIRCADAACRNRKNFTPQRASKLTVTVDMQQVRLQEVTEDEGGRVPRTIDVELTQDNCDTCVPGDVVTVTGVVKVIAEETPAKSKAAGACNSVYLLYVAALRLQNFRNKGGTRTSKIGIDFTLKDYAAIQEIHSYGKDIFKLLVSSLSPSIFGQNIVKAALMLGLFGGTKRTSSDQFSIRADPHILIVGDPGMGKSQILGGAASVAPRGVFVTGNTSTTSGLTVTISKEGGETALEAGALVLADQGCCCIDEFDKMTTQHQALLEAMEQQRISVAKAGIVCSLPARTSILAAANPVGGHYNKAKTVSENLKLNPALLSRFDLVFILIDKPDMVLDSLLSDHVMNLHTKKRKQSQGQETKSLSKTSFVPSTDEESLRSRLQPKPGDVTEDPVPPFLLRKYIAYARKYVFPKLNQQACRVIQDFYLELRRNHQSHDGTPITTRQLESLVRLTEARAKIDLREEAGEQDARDVVDLMKLSLVDTMMDEFGNLDLNRSHMGSGMSQRNVAKRLVSALQSEGERMSKNVFHYDEIKNIARMAKIPGEKLFDVISSLNNQGIIIKKSAKIYQLLSLDG